MEFYFLGFACSPRNLRTTRRIKFVVGCCKFRISLEGKGLGGLEKKMNSTKGKQ